MYNKSVYLHLNKVVSFLDSLFGDETSDEKDKDFDDNDTGCQLLSCYPGPLRVSTVLFVSLFQGICIKSTAVARYSADK